MQQPSGWLETHPPFQGADAVGRGTSVLVKLHTWFLRTLLLLKPSGLEAAGSHTPWGRDEGHAPGPLRALLASVPTLAQTGSLSGASSNFSSQSTPAVPIIPGRNIAWVDNYQDVNCLTSNQTISAHPFCTFPT